MTEAWKHHYKEGIIKSKGFDFQSNQIVKYNIIYSHAASLQLSITLDVGRRVIQ